MKSDCSVVLPDRYYMFSGAGILLVGAVADCAELEVTSNRSLRGFSLCPQRSALIASRGSLQIVSRAGAWRFQKIPLFETVKLLVFLEGAVGWNDVGRDVCLGSRDEVMIDVPGDLSLWKFECWLIARVLGEGGRFRELLDFLLGQESYGVVRFLLCERAYPQSVAALAARYGVSQTHFRRLCRQALGCGLKRELRRWRAATAVLDVVEGRDNMTGVAMSNGFSSSSHFSSEIKDLFGISLGQLKRKK